MYGHAMNHVAGAQKKTTDALVSLACTWRVNERLDIAVLFVFRPHRAGAASLQPTHHLLKPTRMYAHASIALQEQR